MPLINTQYDGKIGKIFVLRGDVGYASSTDTLLDIISDANSKNSIDGYKVGFKYNVLRDKGASKVVLYDDDEVLAEYDWDSDDGETFVGVLNNHTTVDPTTCLYLSYGKEHNLTMRYKGNDKCMKSKSRKVRVYEPIPPQFESSVTIKNVEVVWDTTINGTVEVLMGGVETEYCDNVDVEIHLDGELKTTVTTGSNPSTVDFQLTNVPTGSHIITAYVVPTDAINGATTDYIVSVGYKVQIKSYPTPFVLDIDNEIVVSLTDFNDEPIVGESITFDEYSETTDAKGEATFTLDYLQDRSYVARYDDYVSEPVTIRTYNPEFNMIIGKNPITYGESTTVMASLSQPVPNVPVRISKRYFDESEEIEHYDLVTDDNGVAFINVDSGCDEGDNIRGGRYDYVGLIGNLSRKITLNDAFVWYDVNEGESNSVSLNRLKLNRCRRIITNQGLVLQETDSSSPPTILTPLECAGNEVVLEMDFISNNISVISVLRRPWNMGYLDIPVNNDGRIHSLKLIHKRGNVMDVYFDGVKLKEDTMHNDMTFQLKLTTSGAKDDMAVIKSIKFYDATRD